MSAGSLNFAQGHSSTLPLLAIQQVDHFQFIAKIMQMMSPFVSPLTFPRPPHFALPL